MEATSLLPYINDANAPQRTRVYAEHSNDALLTGPRLMTMIRERNMKLTHCVDDDRGMLFDLDADPKELSNLWEDPEHTKTRDWLIDEILDWRSESALKTQGFIAACVSGAHSLMSPPMKHIARGQHPEGNR